ncbi:MAG: 2-keto-4-pentenoate hydratase [Actinobacteria bacterium]|nr:2-keto-4-pentenoate hydratase [Actinomycetota bacterium]
MTSLDRQQAKDFADALHEARRTRTPIDPLTEHMPDLGMEDGYAVQQLLVERLVADGEVISGYKLGLTSAPMQRLLGVNQPDFSPIFASTVHEDGADIRVDAFIAPRVEAEIAVTLDSELSGPHCTAADVYQATRGLTAAIEIVDSRIRDWKITIADTVADLASNGAIALMVFTKNGDVVATGAGAAALGDPLAAVAWLANTLAPLGAHLPASSVIMTGALHAMVPIQAGDTFRAEFDHLGPITLKVVGEEE